MSGSLEGVTVLVTRAEEQHEPLLAALARRGADTVSLPCVRIEHLVDPAPLAAAVDVLGPADWIVATSRAGVDAVARAVPPAAIRARVAAPRPGTARGWRELGLEPWVPSRHDVAGLAAELPLTGAVLWARAEEAIAGLAELLHARGAEVREVVAYRTVAGARGDVDGVRERFANGEIDAVLFFSPSAVAGLLTAIAAELVRGARPVAIGATTAARVHERLGVEAAVADEPSVEGIVRAVERITAREVRDVARA